MIAITEEEVLGVVGSPVKASGVYRDLESLVLDGSLENDHDSLILAARLLNSAG